MSFNKEKMVIVDLSCCVTRGLKHYKMCCYGKTINFRLLTLLHHITVD